MYPIGYHLKVFKNIEELLPNLRRLLSIDLGDASGAEVVGILRSFTAMCQLQSEGSEPHPQNQKILYNFGEPIGRPHKPVVCEVGPMQVSCLTFWTMSWNHQM